MLNSRYEDFELNTWTSNVTSVQDGDFKNVEMMSIEFLVGVKCGQV